MIPLKLELKNFLSYGETESINFEPYHLICLCGKNGHGKSALLDAITWALWGQARKIHGAIKADYYILRLGETQMMVSFEFLFNDQRYRIRREYAQTYGKPHAALDFGIVDEAQQAIRSLTDKTIRATQEKISEIIGLDYDTFINTAFLRQGNSNEFSKKTPKERKEILAGILGLNTYEQLRKCALEKVRAMNQEHHYFEQTITSQNTQLEQKKNIIEAQKENTQALLDLNKQEQKNNATHKKLDDEKRYLQEQKNDLATILKKHQENLTEQNKHRASIKRLFGEWRKSNQYLFHLPDSHALERNKEKLQKDLAQFQVQLQKNLELKDALLTIKEKEQRLVLNLKKEYHLLLQEKQVAFSGLDQTKTTLLAECKKITKQHKDLSLELTSQQKDCTSFIDQKQLLTNDPKRFAFQEEQFEKRKKYYHTWIARANDLTTQCKELQIKLSINKQNTTNCPLCEQNLSASRRKFLHQKFQKKYSLYQHQLKRLQLNIKKVKQQLIELHAALQIKRKQQEEEKLLTLKIEQLQKQQASVETQSEQLDKQQHTLLEDLKHIEEKLKTLKKNIAVQQQKEAEQIQTNEAFIQLQKTRKDIEQQLLKNSYNQTLYTKTLEELKQKEKQQQNLARAQEEKIVQNERRKKIHELSCSLKELKTEQQKLPKGDQLKNSLEKKEHNLTQQEQKLFNETQHLKQLKEQTLEQKGTIDQKLQTLEQLEKTIKEQTKQKAVLTNNIDEFQTIATAFGKNGIQALLIEDAIPEIEHEANALLAKLTNNQSHIIIESLKDLKKGGTKETLDIKISDAMGTRPYEMFSGGEAFRIDFALRIAISKLLARRAGTSLQTLIIDEGFGSQDEEGLQHIMDAIHKIQDDFCKVIIVSHLSSLKEQFPVHFLINKDMNGSHVTVHELG